MSFYIVPEIGTGALHDARRPKYISALTGVKWSQVDFGDTAIVWAATDPTQEAAIAANPDAVLIPPLDNTITAGALAAVQSELEAQNIPAGWVTAGMTYRSVLRVVVGMAQLIQRVQGLGVNPVIVGNLNKTISQFPTNVQTTLAAAVDSLGLDRTNITGSTTLRAALLDIGQQFIAGSTISLGDL